MKIKLNIFKLLIFVLLIPILNNCGKLGTIQLYEFNATKAEVDSNLTEIIRTNPNFEPKGKWADDANETKILLRHLKLKFLYYQSDPEEMVMISFAFKKSWKT
ncbi:MAG: hypothetical protein RO257_07365 [Candidatus Kapabacteria bacterium]|nr:hypothetical protein [Candidatus Kapabacteria bacterium]